MNFLKRTLYDLLRELSQVVVRHPVEMGIGLCSLVLLSLGYHDTVDEASIGWGVVLPLFFIAAFALDNRATAYPWRWLYRLCWLPILPLAVWGDGWIPWSQSNQYFISVAILGPLVLLLSRRNRSDVRFIADALAYLEAGAWAGILALTATLLFLALFRSIVYIFGIMEAIQQDVTAYAWYTCIALLFPAFLLTLFDRTVRSAAPRLHGFTETLVDCMISPALLLYAAILYLYAIRILVTWTLPKGGVAYLIFGFMTVAFAVKALQPLLVRRRFARFFDRLGAISVPLLALFWIGVLRRIREYGLTDWRVYLVVCGLIMTFCGLIFLHPRTGRYRWVCAMSLLLFGTVAYVPRLSARRIAIRSQVQRAERLARLTGLLAPDGTLRKTPVTGIDSTDLTGYHALYRSFEYLSAHDTSALNRFGITELRQYTDLFPADRRSEIRWGTPMATAETHRLGITISLQTDPGSAAPIPTEGYTTLYLIESSHDTEAAPRCSIQRDTLRIDFGGDRSPFVISLEELARRQLHAAGIPTDSLESLPLSDSRKIPLLLYRDETLLMLFRELYWQREDTAAPYRLRNAAICAIMTR